MWYIWYIYMIRYEIYRIYIYMICIYIYIPFYSTLWDQPSPIPLIPASAISCASHKARRHLRRRAPSAAWWATASRRSFRVRSFDRRPSACRFENHRSQWLMTNDSEWFIIIIVMVSIIIMIHDYVHTVINHWWAITNDSWFMIN
jgi:hypothetical protein